MTLRLWLFALVTIPAIVFAGCIGDDSQSTGDPAGNGNHGMGSGPAQFDDTTGGIDGIVTDEELVPIVGAVVGLLGEAGAAPTVVVNTDQSGRFALSHVTPGDHIVAASALGFESGSQRVSVEAGAVHEVSLILNPLPSEAPYEVTIIRKAVQSGVMLRLSPQCLYLSQSVPEQVPNRNLLKTCNGARLCEPLDGDCEGRFVDELLKETDWKSMVVELDWQAQSGATGRAYWLDLSGPNVSRQAGGSIDQADKRYWMKHQGDAPIQIRIDLPTTLVERDVDEADWYSYPGGQGCAQSSCAWLYRAWPSYCDLSSGWGGCGSTPVDYGIQQGASYTVYFSIFYKEPAPVDFTGVPDA